MEEAAAAGGILSACGHLVGPGGVSDSSAKVTVAPTLAVLQTSMVLQQKTSVWNRSLLANLAENPETHEAAFGGLQGSAFELLLIRAPTAAEQREGLHYRPALAGPARRQPLAVERRLELMALLLEKATQALQRQPDGRVR